MSRVATSLPGSDPASGATIATDDSVSAMPPADADIEIIGINLAAADGDPGNAPAPDSGAGADGGLANADEITIICHAPGGRRRLGRRWSHGPVIVPLDRLSDTDIELLRADPQFSVILPSA